MFKPITVKQANDPPPEEWRIDNIDGGVVYTDFESKLLDTQSPDMLNLWFKERALTKRYGQEEYIKTIGTGQINGIHRFRKSDGTTILLIAHGGKIYNSTDLNEL